MPPPAEGGIHTLGAAPGPQFPDKAVNVPVTMLHKFQQTQLFENLEVPQIQFIDRVLDIAGLPQKPARTVPNCAEMGGPTGAVLGKGC